MPKSVKEVLLEREYHDSLKGYYNVIPAIDTAILRLEESKANSKLNCEALDLSIDRVKAILTIAKNEATKSVSIGRNHIAGLAEAKQFEEDADFAHFSHGLMTCYIDPVANRFILTKDSHNGLHNYDTIINMTKNDLKNIIKCCEDMLADIKANKVPDEEEESNA